MAKSNLEKRMNSSGKPIIVKSSPKAAPISKKQTAKSENKKK